MTTPEILSVLKKAGKPQTAAIYRRLRSGDNVFGALTSEIGKLQKNIRDRPCACNGALENRKRRGPPALGLQVADPERLTRTDADRLLEDGPVRFVWPVFVRARGAEPDCGKDDAGLDEVERRGDAREVGYAISSPFA